MAVMLMDIEFVKQTETKRCWVYQQPRHVATNLVTTDLYIRKEQFPNGPPDRITVVIEARTKE